MCFLEASFFSCSSDYETFFNTRETTYNAGLKEHGVWSDLQTQILAFTNLST